MKRGKSRREPGRRAARAAETSSGRTSARSAIRLTAAPLLFLVLAATCFEWSYVSDDLAFLGRALSFRFHDLLPSPQLAFYRPLSREIYFAFINVVAGSNPFLAHVANAVLIVIAILLISDLVDRLLGAPSGLLAGLFFAASGPLPFMAGWISCSQDILAILFLVAALRFQLGGRTPLAVLMSALALLSKESAIFVLPIIAMLRPILKGSTSRLRRELAPYALLALGWGLLHPGVRGLLVRGVVTGPGNYVGFDNPRAFRQVAEMMSTLLNIPPSGLSTRWPGWLDGVAVAASGVVLAVAWSEGPAASKRAGPPYPIGRVVAVGALIAIVPGILAALGTKHWFPYYACLPAVGASIALSALGARLGARRGTFLVLGFLGLGLWYRGLTLDSPGNPCERNWRVLSTRLGRIESGLLKLHPTLPRGARLYVNIEAPFRQQIHAQLFQCQAPAVWYGDPTIQTLDIEHFRPNGGLVFWVDSNCNIFEVTMPSLRPRTAGSSPTELDYQKTLRRLALGLYRAGAVDRAVSVLMGIRAPNRVTHDFDQRMASMLLFAAGRRSEAVRLRDRTIPIPVPECYEALAAVLGATTGPGDLDGPAFRAFGVSPDDPKAYRYLMNFFSDRVQLDLALRMANHLLSLRPDDEEANLMRQAVLAVPDWQQIVPPAEPPRP